MFVATILFSFFCLIIYFGILQVRKVKKEIDFRKNGIVTPEDFQKLKKSGALKSVQPHFRSFTKKAHRLPWSK